jgi:hypothetical protein
VSICAGWDEGEVHACQVYLMATHIQETPDITQGAPQTHRLDL